MAHSTFAGSLSFGGSHHGHGQQELPFKTSKESLRVLLLHGNLEIWILEAKHLPNMDMLHKTLGDMIGRFGKLSTKLEGKISNKVTSDPYVTVSVSGAVVARTFVITNSENPVWRQHFNVSVAHYASEVHFVVKDNDVVGSQLIGAVGIPVQNLCSGTRIEGAFPILNDSGNPCKSGAVLSLSVQFTPMEKVLLYHPKPSSNSDFLGVPETYFPLKKGGKVTLYQDAHVHGCGLPNLMLDNGVQFEHSSCWHDIFEAISQARRLIYIVGWSVYHKVRLIRDGKHATESMLGDLLKTKSQEGVRVLLLVWDDPTSRSVLGFKKDGLMGTFDEDTRRFFKHSSVQVLLCPRSAGKGHSWAKKQLISLIVLKSLEILPVRLELGIFVFIAFSKSRMFESVLVVYLTSVLALIPIVYQEVGTIYTHHQKTVIVDADAGNYKRKITAFVGGLDLCKGRYDTPHHPVLRGLDTVHQDDFHNPNLAEPCDGCPREPWHDLHSRIEGPAAYDVLANFEERWRRASKQSGLQKLKSSYDDALLSIERISDIIPMAEVPCLSEDNPETWNVQIFRSIDSGSVKGFPKDPKDATEKNLVCGKNVLIDMSIHTAYVKAIRSAQHFIYIENQYFLGSSFNWNSHRDLGANNLIPMEIALKIVNKIKANERFSAYIVIPMWPEGAPASIPTQRILFWQNKTMQMMYEMIYNALKEAGLENKYEPQDYLNFFCLGNREAPDGQTASVGASSAEKTPQALTRKNRRFMVYVHSKGMIVDDEYVIIGSANINQRSLDGTRDTEIAMGAYQPHHTWARKRSAPHGQCEQYSTSGIPLKPKGVKANAVTTRTSSFRRWGLEESFKRPESLECVRRIRSLGEQNWRQYISDEATEMKAHLLKYPVEVDKTGKVKSIPGCDQFPDVGGNILGTFVGIQENLTI
ncbi:hypothetical protein TIFTF001_003664 [Ficus carica]|uniref:Phospholipase D n=1 Tax=Ficus carica TaxID=3494 RepID=A0AA88DB09_FICCA|nr:hypothetical protein TIFTF001_003664 [Ficus carica]